MNQDREKIREEWMETDFFVAKQGINFNDPKKETADWWLNKMALRDAETLQKVEEIVKNSPIIIQDCEKDDIASAILQGSSAERSRILSALRTMNNQE